MFIKCPRLFRAFRERPTDSKIAKFFVRRNRYSDSAERTDSRAVVIGENVVATSPPRAFAAIYRRRKVEGESRRSVLRTPCPPRAYDDTGREISESVGGNATEQRIYEALSYRLQRVIVCRSRRDLVPANGESVSRCARRRRTGSRREPCGKSVAAAVR